MFTSYKKIIPIQRKGVTERADHIVLSYLLHDAAVSNGRFAVRPVSDTCHLEASGADVRLDFVMPPFFFYIPSAACTSPLNFQFPSIVNRHAVVIPWHYVAASFQFSILDSCEQHSTSEAAVAYQIFSCRLACPLEHPFFLPVLVYLL